METNLQQLGTGKRLKVSAWLSALFVPNQAPAHRSGKTALIRQRGFTLLELIVTLALLSLLAGAAIPVARNQIQRQREKELRRNLREIRMAIDSFHKACPRFTQLETECYSPMPYCYPKELKCLVDGVADAQNKDLIHRFLRKLPRDPMTNSFDWGTEPSSADVGGEEDIYDVFSKSGGTALNGSSYKDW